MPRPTVSATCRPKNRKAMKLKNAAQPTANCGRSTRVETMVAIEFAASCRPFRKSKASATTIRPTRTGRLSATASIFRPPRGSNVLDHDALDLVRHVVEAVDHLLEMIVDLVADEEGDRVGSRVLLIEPLQPGVVHLVGAALDLGDFLGNGGKPRRLGRDRAQQR